MSTKVLCPYCGSNKIELSDRASDYRECGVCAHIFLLREAIEAGKQATTDAP